MHKYKVSAFAQADKIVFFYYIFTQNYHGWIKHENLFI